MIAHIRNSDGKEQGCKQHCENVAELCAKSSVAKIIGLSALVRLIGILHDFGKLVQCWQDYIRGSEKKHPNHAVLGALYVWNKWGVNSTDDIERQTAQIISMCVYGHHSGLPDCLEGSGRSPFLDGLKSEEEERKNEYKEAMCNFYTEIKSESELDEMFAEACLEIRELRIGMKKKRFSWTLLTRLLLSVLVDADRWDSWCFEHDVKYDEEMADGERAEWGELLNRLEDYLDNMQKGGDLQAIREEVSLCCKISGGEVACGKEKRIYSLSVPTGGGKTYSSLRFGLSKACTNGVATHVV